MSENKPHPEADAVLSTVRRIVTRSMADPSVRAPEPVEAPHPSPEEERAERLLLTPALRVDETDADPAPELPPRRRPRVTTRTLTAERITLEQRIAELEKAVSDDGSWEPDGSEEIDTETPRRFPFGYRPPEDEIEDATILTDEPKDAPAAPEAPIIEAAPDPASATLRFRTDRPDEPARPEPAVEAVAPTQDTSTDETAAPDLVEESIIDEEMLRDIVAEIVRQELQGELGERITRNVRKLVRREIHRAIMTRDFN
ncbi:hypothetical protein [Ovoidimarina sediminis]|uniref:hypothetical protein n=1 Tax=Ovoidimarina sediminis TaxID=3079856 RepID=UPI00290F61AE|nr:hypothetical protein [Rhodophyticola sp. MJ-SS7]MDU8944942.1 hypothetical protein [Rhodophyticola sp. MJ-SS7]